MNSWSRRRKRIILSIVFLALIILVGVPVFFLFYRAPTCFDGKRNGDESGVDCGGSCQLLCRTESLPLILKGDARVLTLATSTYQVVALVENANHDAEIYRAGYVLKLYDSSSAVPIKTLNGSIYVPVGSLFTVFEGPFSLENDVSPNRVTLDWQEETLIWRKNTSPSPVLQIKDKTFFRLDSNPKLEAIIENQTLNPVSDIDFTALVFDSEGNVLAASKTFVENLLAGEKKQIIFTWPRPFQREPIDVEIIAHPLPSQ